MGFYGNTTDTSHTHFQFDRIFSSRTEMDRACALGTDGIYAGRFVLVKYDKTNQVFQGDILYGFQNAEAGNNSLYMDTACTRPYIYTTYHLIDGNDTSAADWDLYYDKIEASNFYFKLPDKSSYRKGHDYYVADATTAQGEPRDDIVGINTIVRLKDTSVQGLVTTVFMKCVGVTSGQPAVWQVLTDSNEYQDYFTNFELDSSTYQEDFDSRGYDATVWQKVYGEGAGKFILIAKLNGITPTFQLYPNAPSMKPTAPYVDAKSSAELYRIHVPSHWGLRFKEDRPVENGGLSDQQITVTDVTYDQQNEPITTTSTYNASIYFNKAGFNKEKRSNVSFTVNPQSGETNGVQNELLLEPTGESGKVYYDFNGNEVRKDILELSVHLPAIGNMVSDVYDLFYGYNPETQQRYTDIEWVEGDRTDDEKYFGVDRKKTHELDTVAGVINTMHDMIGQNVIHLAAVPTDDQAINLRDGYIYEVNGNYYRRGIGYKKIIVEDYLYRKDPNAADHFNHVTYTGVADPLHYEDTGLINENGNPIYATTTDTSAVNGKTYYYRVKWCTYELDPNAASDFTTNKYYYYDSDTQQFYEYTWSHYEEQHVSGYYLKHINAARFSPIVLLPYRKNTYYYISGENYICDSNENADGPLDPYGTYYTFAGLEAQHFTNIYQANRYHKIDENNNFILQTALAPNPVDDDYYYQIQDPQPAFTYSNDGDLVHPRRIIYLPGLFYKKKLSDSYTELTLAQEENATISGNLSSPESIHYYRLEFSTTKIFTQDPLTGQIYESYPVKAYHDVTEFLVNRGYNETTEEYIKYYYKTEATDTLNDELIGENNYILYQNLESVFSDAYWEPRYFYTLPTNARYKQTQFYLPGRYYIKDTTLSYIKTYETYLNDNGQWTGALIDFYYIQPANVVKNLYPFYRPNIYYYDTSSNHAEIYEPDENAEMTNNRDYFEKTRLFVDQDKRHECPHGFEWSDYAPYIPPSISLYAREEYLTAVPLDKAYSGRTDLTTINDFLLYLNRTYDPDNEETRDLTTFRGTFNTIRDLLYLIKKLEPGKVVYVNHFGQLTTGTKNYSDLP